MVPKLLKSNATEKTRILVVLTAQHKMGDLPAKVPVGVRSVCVQVSRTWNRMSVSAWMGSEEPKAL